MRSRLSAGIVTAVGLTLALGFAAVAAPVSEDTFQARTTGDLVALCASDRTDPLYTAAQNFCHGFAVGTYRALVMVQSGMRSKKKWFCEPTPAPTRNEAIAGFVTWASTRPDILALAPTDGIMTYLEQTERCN